MEPLTQEQQADVTKRIGAFREEYIALTKKHEVDFATYPQYVPNPNGSFSTIVITDLFDKKYTPQPSPLSDSIIKS